MIVDDRLETVLRTAAAGPGAMRTQFRQLVDLLGRTPVAGWTSSHGAAIDRIDSLRAGLGDAASAALISTCTIRSPVLVEHLGTASPKVALAAIIAARLHEAEWLDLIPELPVQARGFLRHRRDLGPAVETLLARFGITDFALPLPAGFEPLVVSAAAAPEPAAETPDIAGMPAASEAVPTDHAPASKAEGIGAIIQRIEAFRRSRESEARHDAIAEPVSEAGGQTRLPFADEPLALPRVVTALELRLDAKGTVVAADAANAPALVGLKPFAADPDAPASCDAASNRAVRARLPVTAGLCVIEGATAVAGTWRIDAVPLFAPETGNFLGYQARLRRPAASVTAAPAAAAANDDGPARSADRLRQLLHELRTPINAIQGYSELIQQQVMGPTPHQYRSLAAGIASDAARMLAGFEDIERLIGLEAGLANGQTGLPSSEDDPADATDLTSLIVRLVRQLEPVLAPREVRLECDMPAEALRVAASPLELERTLWRLMSLVAGASAPGEHLTLHVTAAPGEGRVRLCLPLPAALAMRDDAALIKPDAANGRESPGLAGAGAAMLGTGFALRLAAAEVRALGGQLVRERARLDVVLPLLTAARQALSQSTGPAGQAG